MKSITIITSIASILGFCLTVYHEIKSTAEEKVNNVMLMFLQLAALGLILLIGGLCINLQIDKLESIYIVGIFISCILFYPIIIAYQLQIGLWFFNSYRAIPLRNDYVEKLRKRINSGTESKIIVNFINLILFCLADFCFISLLIIMIKYPGIIGKHLQMSVIYYICIIFFCFSTSTYLKTIKLIYFYPNVCCITLNHAGREEFSKPKLMGRIIKNDEHNYILKGHMGENVFVNKSMIKSVRESESYRSDEMLRCIFKYTTELYELLELNFSLGKSMDIKAISDKSGTLLGIKELKFIQIDSEIKYIRELALYGDFIIEKELFVFGAMIECSDIYCYIINLV